MNAKELQVVWDERDVRYRRKRKPMHITDAMRDAVRVWRVAEAVSLDAPDEARYLLIIAARTWAIF